MRDDEQELTPEQHEILADAPADTTTPVDTDESAEDPADDE